LWGRHWRCTGAGDRVGPKNLTYRVDELVLGDIAVQLYLELTVFYYDEGGDTRDIGKGSQEASFGGAALQSQKDSFLGEETRQLLIVNLAHMYMQEDIPGRSMLSNIPIHYSAIRSPIPCLLRRHLFGRLDHSRHATGD
jgi:hypothetical protein